MAVQAQHYHPLAFVSDFRNTTSRSPDDFLLGEAVLSDPQSELTCNISGSRKRNREESNNNIQPSPPMDMSMSMSMAATHPIHFRYPNQQQQQNNRVSESAMTSTSGRPSSLIISDIYSHLYQQNMEIDATIRLQNERLRSGLEESRKKHCRSLMSSLECHVARRLREKDTELEIATRRNAELEERIRHLAAESQIWFNVAKNNEAIVSSLKSTLDQVLLQNSHRQSVTVKEGYGDSDRTPFPADDAQSCCFEGDNGNDDNREVTATKACKGCGEKDVCVLLLPCRHLCLCKDCESKVDTCPICHGNKNACLQIFMS